MTFEALQSRNLGGARRHLQVWTARRIRISVECLDWSAEPGGANDKVGSGEGPAYHGTGLGVPRLVCC